jgi:hypothetical protein
MPKFNVTFEVTSTQMFIMPIEAENEEAATDECHDKFVHEFNTGDPMQWLKEVNNINIELMSVVPE